jgi:protein-disulfide isomerase
MSCNRIFQFISYSFIALLCSCGSAEQEKLATEVDQLHSDVKELKQIEYRLKTLESELTDLRETISNRSKETSNEPIQAKKFTLSGSHIDDPFLGEKKAPILVMTFSDFQCRPCREFYDKSFPKLVEEFADTNRVWFVYRDFPLVSNPHAAKAAQAAHCSGEQGLYWEMFNLLFENQSELDKGNLEFFPKQLENLRTDSFSKCMSSTRYNKEIEKDIEEGKRLGAKGVPTFLIGVRKDDSSYDGVLVRGAQPYAVLRDQILRIEKKSAITNGEA